MAAKQIPGKAESKVLSTIDIEMIGTAEASKILGVDASTLRRWLADGRLKGVKVGRNWRFDRRTVEEMASTALSAVRGADSQVGEIPTASFIESLWQQIEVKFGKQTLAQAKKAAEMFQTASSEGKKGSESLLCALVGYASEANASDLHIEPVGKVTRIRLRMDGVLHEGFRLPPEAALAVIAEMKSYAGINTSESLVPQDGLVQLELPGRTASLVWNTSPSVRGENMVIKVFDPHKLVLGIDQLGLEREQGKILKRLITQPNGLILLSGGPNSGKTTTLYSLLCEINKPSRKIVSIEDPVELFLPGIQQIELKPNLGLSFPRLLRNTFRQNADVVMVGEIRDAETSGLLFQGAQKGHLMLSSIQAISAAAAFIRVATITDIGPAVLKDTILAVIAQRLVRRLCTHCRESFKPTSEDLKGLTRPKSKRLYRAKGCEKCFGSGFRGMLPLVEIIMPDDDIKAALRTGNQDDIHKALLEADYQTMLECGLVKVAQGETTIEEVVAACGDEREPG